MYTPWRLVFWLWLEDIWGTSAVFFFFLVMKDKRGKHGVKANDGLDGVVIIIIFTVIILFSYTYYEAILPCVSYGVVLYACRLTSQFVADSANEDRSTGPCEFLSSVNFISHVYLCPSAGEKRKSMKGK